VIAFGKSLHDNTIIAKGMLAKAYVLSAQADVEAAHRLAFDAEKLALTTSDTALQVQATITAGQSYAEQGNFPAALVKLQHAVDIARPPAGDAISLVAALNALAKLHVQMKEYENASETLDELLAETEKLKSPGRMAMAKNTEYALAIESGQPKRALRALLQSLDLERKLGAERMVGITLVNLSDSYLKNTIIRAPRSTRRSRCAPRRRPTTTHRSHRAHQPGPGLHRHGPLAEGKKQYEAGMKRYEQENNKPDLQAALREYGEALERAGDLAGAVSAYHRERAISNELFEKRRQQAMLELQEKYETEKKQRQIELLSRENQVKGAEIDNRRLQQRVWWLLALVFALAAAVVGLLYRKVRHTNAQLEVKNLELKAQSTLDPLTSLYNRRHFQEFMRSLNTRSARRHRRRAVPAGRRPLQAYQRQLRPRSRRRGAEDDRREPAHRAARNRHDRALGRRRIPRLPAGDPAPRRGRSRAPHPAEHLVAVAEVSGARDFGECVGRLLAVPAGAGRRAAAMGARGEPGRHGAVPGQGAWPQPRLRRARLRELPPDLDGSHRAGSGTRLARRLRRFERGAGRRSGRPSATPTEHTNVVSIKQGQKH
jgi:tetratricopeptide (TPR) repeat protein